MIQSWWDSMRLYIVKYNRYFQARTCILDFQFNKGGKEVETPYSFRAALTIMKYTGQQFSTAALVRDKARSLQLRVMTH